ncbi:MAG: Uma2 family endonuclease [Chloroherpetonaceae bacterium]
MTTLVQDAPKPATPPHQEFPSEIEDMQSDTHTWICTEFISALRALFADDPDVAIGGDTGFYWNSQDDRDRLVPDAYLVRHAGKHPRKSWKLWEEKSLHPNLSIDFVLEVWSDSNSLPEKLEKFVLYQRLGAKEYLQLDTPTNTLFAHRLDNNGIYTAIATNEHGRLPLQSLNADVIYENGLIRLYRNNQKILTLSEAQAELDALRNELAQLKKSSSSQP